MRNLFTFLCALCLSFCAIATFAQTQETEPNDGFITANIISFDSELKGTSVSRNEDFFKITVSKPMILNISLSGISLGQSIQVQLYDINQKSIESKFFKSSDEKAVLSQLVCSTGIYYIKVNSVTGSSNYTLKVKSDVSDIYECNNSFNDAKEIPLNKEIKASINNAGDEDFFKINVREPSVINISLENIPVDQRMNLYIYDSNQVYIGKETASENGKNVYFSKLVCGGTYYIKIYSINNVANNAQYTLKVQTDVSDVYECNNSLSDAKQIALNTAIKASINSTEDEDFYKINISKPSVVNVSVEGVDANQLMYIEMYDANLVKLGKTYSSKGKSVFYNQLQCSAGVYYIRLYTSAGVASTSQYTMKVQADVSDVYECNNTFDEAKEIKLSTTIKGAINPSGDKDFYKFTLLKKSTVNFSFVDIQSGMTAYLDLYDQNLKKIVGGTNPNNLSSIQKVVLDAGQYFIRIFSNQTNPALYSLTVNPDACPHTAKINTPNGTSFCSGSSINIVAEGSGITSPFTYKWKQGNTDVSTGATLKVTQAGTFNVEVTDKNGCVVFSSITVSEIAKPTQPKITASNSTICLGSSVTLTSTTCTGGTLTWTGGVTGSSITVSPTATKSYKVLCTQGTCKSDSSLATTITVIAKPTQPKITASNSTICGGSSTTLTSTACAGGISTWTGGLTGSSITVSPSVTKSYKVLCTQGTCKSDSSLATTITVIAKPTQPKIAASNSTICAGSSVTLTSTACTSGILTWTGGLTGSSITVSPNVSKSYKVLCTQGTCKSDSSVATTITVIAKPTQPKITASNSTICAGSSVTLTSTACTGGVLTWTGGLTGNSITVSPTATKSYKVLCTQGTCKSDSSLATTITVIAKPTQPKITASNSTICSGNSTTLTSTACAGGVLTWTGGATGSSITVTPNVTKSYKVLCMQGTCKSDSSIATTITVTPKPTQPKITASNSTICAGSSVTLTSTACTGGVLTWTGGATGSTITVSPTVTKSYKVLCTQGTCKSDSSLATTITVIAKPTQPKITVSNSTICLGSSTTLTSSACTGGTLTWTGGLTGSSITVSPTINKSYKVLCTQGTCKSDSSLATTIIVIAKPTQPKITASSSTICGGSSTTLTSTACAGGVLTWTGGATGSSITVSPTATKSYKVLCTQAGCKSDSSVATTITVIAKPTQPKITASNSTICAGSSVTLTSTACTGGTLTWTGGATGSSITVSPTATKSYKVLCTVNGCKSDSSTIMKINILSIPKSPIISSNICNNILIKQWDKTFKGDKHRILTSVLTIANGEYLLGGYTLPEEVATGDKLGLDYLIIKIDSKGEKIWEKTYGGKDYDYLTCMVATPDGGFLLGGNSFSGIGLDKSEGNKGYMDFWVVKINKDGVKMWDKTFGGDDYDYISTIVNIDNGGFLLGGSTFSRAIDKTGPYGFMDYYAIKINENGINIWEKKIGGRDYDYLKSVVTTNDGGFLLGGKSMSGIGGDKSDNSRGLDDYWVVKISSSGIKVWDKTFGGVGYDNLSNIVKSDDGGFLLGGYSGSTISGDKLGASKGDYDFWVVKINSNGVKLWDKTIGGNSVDYLLTTIKTNDGGFLLGGYSESGLSGDKSEKLIGQADYWVVKISSSGNKLWDKAFGGSAEDILKAMVITNDNGLLLGGYSTSSDGDKSEMSLGYDFWIIKSKICDNKELTATGCTGTVNWSNGATGNSITVSPTVATTYTATCTVNTCKSVASNAITVSPDVVPNGRIETTVAIESEPSFNFKVFPNPAKDELTIQTDLEGEATFYLYNSIGQKVLEKTFEKQTKIDLKNLSKGSHFYSIEHQEIKTNGKVLLE